MKQCKYCGAQVEDDNLFCTNCGKPILQDNECPHCGAKIYDGDVFCTSCGKEIGKAIEDAPSSKMNCNLTESKKKHFKLKYVFPIFITIIILALVCSAYLVWRNLSKDYSLEGLAKAIPNYYKENVDDVELPIFHEGLACVEKDGKYGFIDKSGKEVIPCIYDYASDFHEGLAKVGEINNYGYIDMTGNEVVPCKYFDSSDFHEGLAWVYDGGDGGGYIDKTGKEVLTCDYESFNDFHEGLACVQKDGKHGFIDKSGKEVIPCIYYYASDFHEGLAYVQKDGEYGFIDKNGKDVIAHLVLRAGDFHEGLASVISKDEMMGFIDKTGKEVIPRLPMNIRYFHEGLARVMTRDNTFGYIDKTGKEVIPYIYDYASDFNEGLACVRKDGKYGYIDITGNEVIPFIYDNANNFSEGLAFVSKDGMLGVVDTKGNSTFDIDSGKIIEDGSRKVSSSEEQKIDDVGSTKGKESSNPKQVNPTPNATSQDYNEKIMMHTTEIQNIMREMNSIYNSCIASSALNPDQARGVNACADISELALEGDRHFKAMISLSRKEGHPEHAKAIQQEMDDFDYKANQMTRNILRLNDSMYN